MTDAIRKTPQGPAQIYAPLKTWFEAKQAEAAPEHLVALVDELNIFAQEQPIKKAS